MAVEYPYDSLIVAAGVTQSYFGHDEFAFFAPGMKTLDDALELRRRIFGAFEVAEMVADPVEKERWLTVVVVGAGPTGVELAGQVRELATRSLRGEFRTFEASSVRVILVDGGTEPLATFGDQLSGKAAKTLEHLGIELRMGAQVVGIDADGVDVKGPDGDTRIDARTTIWAAGVQASPLAGLLAEASRRRRWTGPAGSPCSPTSPCPAIPRSSPSGDMASLDKLPGVAEVAMQGGLHAANTILRRLKGEPTKPFRYRDLGQRGHHRPLPGHREREGDPPERVPGLGGVDVRPPGLPHRVRQSAHHHAEVAPLDDRTRPGRAGVQHRPHRWRPEPSRFGPETGRAHALPGGREGRRISAADQPAAVSRARRVPGPGHDR